MTMACKNVLSVFFYEGILKSEFDSQCEQISTSALDSLHNYPISNVLNNH
ncbi:hypothetical protein SMMN14_02319 [Sphaerulina musiva]